MKDTTHKKRLLTYIKRLKSIGTRSLLWQGMAVITLLAYCQWIAVAAMPPAGATIGNQASATYTDASNTPRTATSNPVVTIVQQVYGLDLQDDGSKVVAPGSQVAFAHTVVNTGNGADTISLSAANSVADNFNFTGIQIYADANGDGIPDDNVAISTTPSIASGGSFQFVVVGTVPGTASAGQNGKLTVTASDAFSQTDVNTDTALVTGNAAINITKSIDVSSGLAGSGPHTYTIIYQNTGNDTATDLVISDLIPANMTYVPASGRASITASTVLTDSSDSDSQGTSPNTLIYDYDVTDTGKVTVKIAQVEPGQSGNISFKVTVKGTAAPGKIINTADYEYNDGDTDVGPYVSNPAIFTVLQSAGVTLGDDTIANATQGSTITFTNALVNTGNGTDSFDLSIVSSTFPSGSTITFYNSGGAPMTDSGGSPAPDTGPLAAGASYNVLVVVTLPPSAIAAPYVLVKRATSTFNNSVSDNGTDTLTAITPNTVDLVNDAPAGPGLGAGPEATAVTTISTDPGTTTTFVLYVDNNSTVADTFDLSVSTDSSFSSISLPAGWNVVFKDSSDATISGTGTMLPSTSKRVNAYVTVPSGQTPGTFSLYFRVQSPTTGVGDIKHDAVTVNTVRSLKLTPNNSGQVFPGGSVVYQHVLANQGNVSEGIATSPITFTIANSQTSIGFGSVVYRDANSDGVLGATDPVVTMANVGAIAPGGSATFFVKVFAPASAKPGMIDVATLTASTVQGSYSVAAPADTSATDTTTVISGDVTIEKVQALDTDNSGTLTGAEAYTTATITSGGLPGSSIIYKLTVKNTGTANATSVVVTDTTPTFTTYSDYSGASPAAMSPTTSQSAETRSITAPGDGTAGAITADLKTLKPGETVTITFGVTINE